MSRKAHAEESRSGLQLLRPRIWGAFHRQPGKVAAIVIHPTSNFMHHYLLEPPARRGIAALGLSTRYLGSDVSLPTDPAIDPNDRPAGTTVWGAPRMQNFAGNSMGRFTTLTAFLSQWARCSRGDGPKCLWPAPACPSCLPNTLPMRRHSQAIMKSGRVPPARA